MSTQPERTSEWIVAPDVLVFAGESQLPVGAVEQHDLVGWAGNLFGRSKEDVQADWERVVAQIQFLLEKIDAFTGNYELDEIGFELGFSAEGKIVFVAKAGITTTIKATFKRKSHDEGRNPN